MKSNQKIMLILVLLLTFSVSAVYATDLLGVAMNTLNGYKNTITRSNTYNNLSCYKNTIMNSDIYSTLSGKMSLRSFGVKKMNYTTSWATKNITLATLTRQVHRPIVSRLVLGTIASTVGLSARQPICSSNLLADLSIANNLKIPTSSFSFPIFKEMVLLPNREQKATYKSSFLGDILQGRDLMTTTVKTKKGQSYTKTRIKELSTNLTKTLDRIK
ncbi:MAG: hypothetical protein KAJ79_00340 [Candidatus Omnitrophica bacterium]|nr:hypothetical protein [Candidatus Omnitrophota bacterium]